MPDRQTWASTIGLFIMNFGVLDLDVQDYLENNLPPEEFARFKDRHFHDRIDRMQKHVQRPEFDAKKRVEFEGWSSRLEPIRKIRNHIAHGLLRLSLADDNNKTWRMTVSLPRDLGGDNSPAALHLSLEDLHKASRELTALIGDFQTWTGGWVTDATIRF
jgi:hypothetical protein